MMIAKDRNKTNVFDLLFMIGGYHPINDRAVKLSKSGTFQIASLV